MKFNPRQSWRSLTIEEAINKVAEPLVGRGLATKDRGSSIKAIQKAEKRLGGSLPEDLKFFYRHVTPVPECPSLGGGSVGFQPIDDPDLVWLDNPGLREEKLWVCPQGKCWLEGWNSARLLVIGYTEFGDWLLWTEGLSGRKTGTILLTDHEGERNPIVLADSFAQWLGRYWVYGFRELSIAEGELINIDPDQAEAFFQDHVRLNPPLRGGYVTLAKSPDNLPDEPGSVPTWAVHRQDDNGNRFVVENGLTRKEAEKLVAMFENRGHKQVYWVEQE